MISSKKIKFPIHDLHFHKSLKGVVKAGVASLIVAAVFCTLHNAPRRAKYQAYYSNYDACKSFERMKEGGYLQSALPSEEESGNAKGGKGGKDAKDDKDKCKKQAKDAGGEKAKK